MIQIVPVSTGNAENTKQREKVAWSRKGIYEKDYKHCKNANDDNINKNTNIKIFVKKWTTSGNVYLHNILMKDQVIATKEKKRGRDRGKKFRKNIIIKD